MVTGRTARTVGVLAMIVLPACSGSSDDTASTSTSATATSTVVTGTTVTEPATPAPAESTAPATTDVPRPGVAAFEGSVEDVIGGLSEASNFVTGVTSWLDEVPGQEGVLRNDRGVTLFVPVDTGFSADDRDAAFADPDASALIIGRHLRVGILETLSGEVTTAAGETHVVTDGPTIGGRRVVRSVTATNGVIHLIAGPLPLDG